MRAFVLAPSPTLNRSTVPRVEMRSCSAAFGCAAAVSPLYCTCISLCVGTTLSWAAVYKSKLRLLRTVGSCGEGGVLGRESVVEMKIETLL